MIIIRILVDFDDTMTDLLSPWVKELNEQFGTKVQPSDINNWYITGFFPDLSADEVYSPLHNPEFWKKVNARADAQYFLHKLITNGHDVYIVTNTHYNVLKHKMRHCFTRLFPFIDYNKVIVATDKYLIKGDVIIDDAFHNLANCDCKKILMTTYSNKNIPQETLDNAGIVRCKTWKQIYDVITDIEMNN